MLKHFKVWVGTALLLVPIIAFTANFNAVAVKGISTAYGFVLGQEYSLARVVNEYPDMQMNMELAKAQFDSTFPNIKQKLESKLKDALGQKGFDDLAKVIQVKLQDTLSRAVITREIATQFFVEMKIRSKGEIDSPVLEYLLFTNYMTNSVGEFSDGFRQRYQTAGAGKAQGIKLNLQLPRSWTAKNGERPHIVQKWTSLNDAGLEMILLDIRDAEGYAPTKKEMEDFVKSGELKEAMSEGATYVASGNFSLEKQNGYWVQTIAPVERAGIKYYQEAVMYQLFFHGKAIGITCSVGGIDEERAKISGAFKRMRPLCQQVVNSLVLLQAY